MGGILLLFLNKRAYDIGAFCDEITCPVELTQIEIYIQILLPALFITLGWEKMDLLFSYVIPSVLYLIHFCDKLRYDDFDPDGNYRKHTNNLLNL